MEITREDCKNETLFDQFDSLIADLENMRDVLLNHVTVHGGFAKGTTTTKFKTSADTHYILAGKHHKKAATDDIAQPASTTNGSQYAKDLISINASGTVTVTAGTKAASQGAAVKPDVPADNVELGWIEVPASFTPGTTDVTAGMLKMVDIASRFSLESSIEA